MNFRSLGALRMVLLWVTIPWVAAFGIELEQRVSSLDITTADVVELTIQARAPEPAEFVFKAPKVGGQLGDFRVRSVHLGEARLSRSALAVEQGMRVELLPYLAGEYQIPSLHVGVVGRSETALSDPVTVTVRSVLPPETDGLEPRPLSPAIGKKPSWVLPVVVVAGLGLLAWWFFRSRLRAASDSVSDQSSDPEWRAEQALSELGHDVGIDGLHEVALDYLEEKLGRDPSSLTAADIGDQDVSDYLRTYERVGFGDGDLAGLRAALKKLISEGKTGQG